MLILLSFKMMVIFCFEIPALFRASKAMPPVIEPSPMTATTLLLRSKWLRATAKPRAAEIEVVAWPAPKQSYSLSFLFKNPEMPPCWRSVENLS